MNPATGEAIAALSCAGTSEALNAADRAFAVWRTTTAVQRWEILGRAASLIDERKESISKVLTIENGKTLSEAFGELGSCVDAIRWYAEEGKRAYGRVIPSRHPAVRQPVVKEPVGSALGFSAWNFPAGNVTLKIAAALAAGCSIIMKPSDETPGTAAAIAQCFHEAGAPPGVLNLVFGDPVAISEHRIRSPIPKKISLTGSTPVGRLLQKLASETLKRCTMELGGHAPVIVFEDADLEKALDLLVVAKFRNAGQVCTSSSRFYVQARVCEAFIDGFIQPVRRIRVGSGLDPSSSMGALTLERRLGIMDGFVQDATLVEGGGRLNRRGFFYRPTVLRDMPDHARIMVEEPFGPIAPTTSVEEFDEVLHRANALPLGLASYVFSRSGASARKAGNLLEAGQVVHRAPAHAQ